MIAGDVRKYIRISVLFGLLLIPIIYALCAAIDLQYSWIKKIAYLLVVLCLLIIPALCLKARAYFIVEGVCNFLFFPIDVASLYLNGQPTSTFFLHNIFATNLSESVELVASMWPIALVVVLLWILYFYLSARIENEYLFPRKVVKIILLSIGGGLVIGMVAMMIITARTYRDRAPRDIMVDGITLAWMKLYKIYPYNLYLETIDLAKEHYTQIKLQKQVASFRFGLKPKHSEDAELYILVIGEAARCDHLRINGYERNTTPLLSQQPNLISFDSAFAQANLTSTSVPLIVTRATASEREKVYSERTLPEAFKEAGFKTGWITKQVPFPFIERAMKECDYAKFYAKGVDVAANYDAEMLEDLKAFTEDTLQFFVLHSLGCHFRYELRYPKEFEQFQPVFGEMLSYSMISKENKEQLINAYDNAILYTDYFLNQIITYADSLNRPAIVLYISDHGESFWDDERELSLHGSYQVSKYEYHVPLLVWMSDEYKTKYPQKVANLLQNKTTPVSSDVVFYSLLDLADVSTIVDSTRSICSPTLQRVDTFPIITGTGSVVPYSFTAVK
ncbi:MAG: phosphoethanolamine transferase [Paludibacteraceae bacterium]|nr:phosphoethanolamine transferase [Paludibacteraceae bacterium]